MSASASGDGRMRASLSSAPRPNSRWATRCRCSRRVQLIEWAKRNDSWIIEDDYDAEFRYQGRSIRSLQGLDGGRRVIYIGTFSKVLFPGLRLAYLVVPEALVELFVNARTVAGRHSPTLEQALVERFMTDGHMARHVLRMRKLYAERRAAMIGALGTTLGGLHAPGARRCGPADARVAQERTGRTRRSRKKRRTPGLEVAPLSRFAIARRLPPAVLARLWRLHAGRNRARCGKTRDRFSQLCRPRRRRWQKVEAHMRMCTGSRSPL